MKSNIKKLVDHEVKYLFEPNKEEMRRQRQKRMIQSFTGRRIYSNYEMGLGPGPLPQQRTIDISAGLNETGWKHGY